MEKLKDLKDFDLITILKSGKVIDLREGDILIFHTNEIMKLEDEKRVETQFKKHIPNNKCILLEGIEFKALLRKKENKNG